MNEQTEMTETIETEIQPAAPPIFRNCEFGCEDLNNLALARLLAGEYPIPGITDPGVRGRDGHGPRWFLAGADLRPERVTSKRSSWRRSNRKGRPAGYEDQFLARMFARRARLDGLSLRGSTISDSCLCEIAARNADFRDVIARNTSFHGAELSGARFEGADLRGADLRQATLNGAVFTGAIYDETTHLPTRFDPAAASMKLVPSHEEAIV